MPINAAVAYQNNKVSTASPAELTMMLYEGAIKFCNMALQAIEDNDKEKGNKNIIKAERIITHLNATLEHKYPVAKDFENVYNLIYDLLVQANIYKDKAILEEALGYIREMCDAWREVMRQGKSNG